MKLLPLLLAGVAAAALLSQPAQADLPVIDVTAIGHLITEAQILSQQLQTAIQTYQEAIQIFNSVNELVNPNQWSAALNDPAMQNPLPFASADFPGIVGGNTDPSAMPFAGQFITQNTVGGDMTPLQDGTFIGGEIVRSIQSISGMQATATNNLASLELRISSVVELVNQLSSMSTLQEVSSVTSRLNAEEHYVQSQQAQASAILTAGRLQLAALKSDMQQYEYLDEQNGIATMCAAYAASGSGMPDLPECSAPSGGGLAVSAGGGGTGAASVAAAPTGGPSLVNTLGGAPSSTATAGTIPQGG